MPEDSDKKGQIVNLATEAFERLSSSMFHEITEGVDKISVLAEKGTVIFLQAIGTVLIITAIILAWRSDSVFEHIVLAVSDRATRQSSPFSQTPYAEPESRSVEGRSVRDLKLPFGAPQFIVLVLGGVAFVCLGSVIDVVVYKWRLDTYRSAQAFDQESIKLKVSLRQSGIQALAETNKVIGNVSTDNPAESKMTPVQMPEFGRPKAQ